MVVGREHCCHRRSARSPWIREDSSVLLGGAHKSRFAESGAAAHCSYWPRRREVLLSELTAIFGINRITVMPQPQARQPTADDRLMHMRKLHDICRQHGRD